MLVETQRASHLGLQLLRRLCKNKTRGGLEICCTVYGNDHTRRFATVLLLEPKTTAKHVFSRCFGRNY